LIHVSTTAAVSEDVLPVVGTESVGVTSAIVGSAGACAETAGSLVAASVVVGSEKEIVELVNETSVCESRKLEAGVGESSLEADAGAGIEDTVCSRFCIALGAIAEFALVSREVCRVEVVAFGVEEICCWFCVAPGGVEESEAELCRVCEGGSCVFGPEGVILETLTWLPCVLAVPVTRVPVTFVGVLRATELCWLDRACCVVADGTYGTLVSNADVVAAEAFEIAGAGETSDSVGTGAIGLPAVCVGVANVAVPSIIAGRHCCETKGDAVETVDVEVALELKLGVSCDALGSPGIWLLDIFSAEATSGAKLVESFRTDVSLGAPEVVALTGTGVTKAL
jgi:hypothetical protein